MHGQRIPKHDSEDGYGAEQATNRELLRAHVLVHSARDTMREVISIPNDSGLSGGTVQYKNRLH